MTANEERAAAQQRMHSADTYEQRAAAQADMHRPPAAQEPASSAPPGTYAHDAERAIAATLAYRDAVRSGRA